MKKYLSAPKSARTFRTENRIGIKAYDVGLSAKFNSERKIWEVWEVKDPKEFIREPTKKVYEGRKVEEFLKDYKMEEISKEEKEHKTIPINPDHFDQILKKIGRKKL